MEVKTYFFDTYAFFEVICNNKDYEKFMYGINLITTRFNLMELYYGLLLKYNKNVAELYYDINLDYCIDVTDEIIKEAMIFRAVDKKRNLSYIDCIGYVLAKKVGARFLTGDKEFEYLDNVEFVK